MDAEQIIQTKTTSGIAFGLKVLGVLGGGPITGKTDGGSLTKAHTSMASHQKKLFAQAIPHNHIPKPSKKYAASSEDI